MKRIKFTLLLALVIVLAVAVGSASAQNAYSASLSSSITYQNVGDGTANIVFSFYAEDNATPINISRTLAAGAGSSLFVGNLTEISSGFSGSAVASSDQPIVATMVQIFDSASGVKNRPLSNGFDGGSNQVLLATVLKNRFSTTTVFSVQNTGAASTSVNVQLFNADNPSAAPITLTEADLPAGAAKYFDLGTVASVPDNFNGSAVITAGAGGELVATALELSTNGTAASAFEGVAAGSSTVYMATALCNAFGATSAYAVQNTGDSAATVNVQYASGPIKSSTIQPGAKQSFNACTDGNSAGYSGSAKIEAAGGEIVAIGKVFGSGNSTAFVGATAGAAKLALPYVRYTTTQWDNGARQRAFIAVQNIGGDLAAGQVTIQYLNLNGQVVGTHTLGALTSGAKANSNPKHASVVGNAADLDEFGYVGGFGGSAIITGPAGSQLVAVVRIQSRDGNSVVGEDYSGIPIN